MSIIMDRQPEMPFVFCAGGLNYIFPGPEQLHNGEGQVGEMFRIGGSPLVQKFGKATRVRRGWKSRSILCGDGLDAIPALGSFHDASNRERSLFSKRLRD